MRVVPLGEAADVNPRGGGKPAEDEAVAFVPMAALSAETARTGPGETRPFHEVSRGYTLFRDQDLLVAKITPCFENNKIGQANLRHEIGVGSSEFHVIRPNPDMVDARYLLHFLRQDRVRIEGERRMTGSGGQRRVPPSFLKELKIPLPSLTEQRRIAIILDQADALRVARRQSIALLDEVPHAFFLEMFGAMTEGLRPVAEVAAHEKASIRTGPFGSQLLHSEFVDEGIAVLGIDNVVTNRFRWHGRRHITPEKYEKLKRYTVGPGDVLITIMGTCGRCVVVPEDIPTAINTKHICAITVDRAQVLPEFLRGCFLWHPVSRRFLLQRAKGAIMDGLNMGIIKEMPMPVPSLGLQTEFVRRARAAERGFEVATRSEREIEEQFSALQNRAFAGQL